MKKIVILVLTILLSLSACKKYPEGPLLSLRSKKARLANTWVISKAFENGVDKTSDYHTVLKDYTLTINKSGTYSITYLAFGSLAISESGNWVFSADKKFVNFKPTSNGNASTVWTILKLKEKELWGENKDYYNGGTVKQELQMVPK